MAAATYRAYQAVGGGKLELVDRSLLLTSPWPESPAFHRLA
jgi:hypothetical protein